MTPRHAPTPCRRAAVAVGLSLGLLLAGCGDEPTEGELVVPADCAVPNRLLADGRCVAPGVQDDGCLAGELAAGDGTCQPAGISLDRCADGFESIDQHCAPILPRDPCPSGLMALPGEDACREVSPCGGGTWGEIPIDATTEHVDLAYAGSDSDGSSSRPWATIGQAVAAAAPGSIVAIAAGSYVEDVEIAGKSLRLIGVCPQQVEIVASSSALAAVVIRGGADGTEIANLSLRGGGAGLVLSGSQDVLVERLWSHDNASSGIQISDSLGPASATILDTLLEQNQGSGLLVSGAQVDMDGLVVRDTRPDSASQAFGRGVAIQSSWDGTARSEVSLRRALLERNHETALIIAGSDAVVEGIVARDTWPEESSQALGRGIIIQPGDGQGATVTLLSSLVDHNHDVGLYSSGSQVIIHDTTVRGTLPRAADGTYGIGLTGQHSADTGQRGNLAMRSCLVASNHMVGILVDGSDAVLEGIVVRETQPQASDSALGRGIGIQHSLTDVGRSSVVVRSSVVERNHELGMFVGSSDVLLEGIVIRDTTPQASDQMFGRAIGIQQGLPGARGDALLRGSRLEGNHDVGVVVAGGDIVVEGTVLGRTARRVSDGLFGDAINLVAIPDGSSAAMSSCLIEASPRAGLAAFGSMARLQDSALECNAIDLDLEDFEGISGGLHDMGGMRCGCGSESWDCQVVSTGLAPPDPSNVF